MRVLYNGVIYNCYTAKRNDIEKTIELVAESLDINSGKFEFEIYFKNTMIMDNCFEDLLVNGHINIDRYDVY